MNRRLSWLDIFKVDEKFHGRAIENQDGKHGKFEEKLADASLVMADPEAHAQQLMSNLSPCTKGSSHAKVTNTHIRNAFELPRHVVYRGNNLNTNKLFAFKAFVLSLSPSLL